VVLQKLTYSLACLIEDLRLGVAILIVLDELAVLKTMGEPTLRPSAPVWIVVFVWAVERVIYELSFPFKPTQTVVRSDKAILQTVDELLILMKLAIRIV
jgi:hypothetical protein